MGGFEEGMGGDGTVGWACCAGLPAETVGCVWAWESPWAVGADARGRCCGVWTVVCRRLYPRHGGVVAGTWEGNASQCTAHKRLLLPFGCAALPANRMLQVLV